MAILRPSQDIITGGWASTDASLTAAIDEATASDTDYISTSTAGDKARVSLGTYTTSAGTHTLKYRACSPEADRGLIARVLELGQPPAIILKRDIWTSQPQVQTIATVKYLSYGYGAPVDLSNNKKLTINGSASTGIGSSGLYLIGGNAIGNGWLIPALNLTTNFSIVVVASISSMPASVARSIIDSDNGAASRHFQLRFSSNATNTYAEFIRFNTSVSAYTASTLVFPVNSGGVVTIVAISKGNNLSVFSSTNNRQYLKGIGTIIGTPTTPTGNILVGNTLSGSNTYGASTYSWAILNSVITEPEAYKILSNPWKIFKPRNRISYFDAPKVIATQTKTYTELGTTPSDQTLTLSAGEVASITNGAELALEVESI